jgi:hypothetical protein
MWRSRGQRTGAQGSVWRRIGRRPPPRVSAAEAGYDSFRVMRGIALGCTLSVPFWVAVGFAVSALVS